jgi:hypothetical protein
MFVVDGPSGPTTFIVEIKVDDGNVSATVNSELMGEHKVQHITYARQRITLSYTGDLWGYSTAVVLTVASKGDQLEGDFSIAVFQFQGVATRHWQQW